MATILLLNGPNLNLLGSREPERYGKQTLAEIEAHSLDLARSHNATLDTLQSNAEHELIDAIQAAPGRGVDCIVFNPGGYTHTSVALRDALLAVAIPFVEVHLSNLHAREPFRRRSMLSDIAIGTISGFGAFGYDLALHAALNHIEGAAAGNK